MKYLITLVFICFSYLAFGQASFYQTIDKAYYDSLDIQTWYRGRILFSDDTQRDGWIHRLPNVAKLQYKESLDKPMISYRSRNKIDGFYIIYEKDTAFFVFLDINCGNTYWEKERALRVLITDPKGLSLLRLSWLEKNETGFLNLFNSDPYVINWQYFLWKDKKLSEITQWKKNLYSAIKDSPEAKKYYLTNKNLLNKENHYLYLSNIIKIYNQTKNAQVVE